MAAWWVASPAWAGTAEVSCPEQARRTAVEAAEQVERAFVELDETGFDIARNQLGLLMSCVETAVTVRDALAFHRARGIVAFVDEDLEAARRSFAAVHALDPTWTFNPDELPVEHPLWAVWEGAVDTDESERPLRMGSTPENGWSVDGTQFTRQADKEGTVYVLPADRAMVLQVYGPDGSPTYTGYHVSPASVPSHVIVVMPDKSSLDKQRRKRARVAGTVLATGLLAGAGATLGLGLAERRAFDNDEVAIEDVDEAQLRGNAFGGTAIGLASAGVLTATMAWTVRW